MVVICVLVCSLAAGGLPPDLPEEIAALFTPYLGDEKALVDALRDFQLKQQALAEWDQDLIKQYAQTGEKQLAETKQEDLKRRLYLIEKACQEVLRRYPNNARALTYSGEFSYDWRGEIAEAVKSWKLATSLDPKLSIPLNNLGIYYCQFGQYAEGLDCFEKVMKLEPDNPDYLFNLAQIYLIHFPYIEKRYKWSRKRVYEEAMKLSKQSAELDPADFDLLEDHALNFFMAENFGAKAEWAKAATAWQRAREHARGPDELFHTWMYEARAWLRLSETAKAETCLREALNIFSDSPTATHLLEEIQARKKQ